MARRLAADGCKVMISSRKEDNVERALKEMHGYGLHHVDGMVAHVGKAEDRKNLIQETIKKMGGVDILISNAAVNPAVGLKAIEVRRNQNKSKNKIALSFFPVKTPLQIKFILISDRRVYGRQDL